MSTQKNPIALDFNSKICILKKQYGKKTEISKPEINSNILRTMLWLSSESNIVIGGFLCRKQTATGPPNTVEQSVRYIFCKSSENEFAKNGRRRVGPRKSCLHIPVYPKTRYHDLKMEHLSSLTTCTQSLNACNYLVIFRFLV